MVAACCWRSAISPAALSVNVTTRIRRGFHGTGRHGVRDAVGHDPRLARPRPGVDDEGPAGDPDGLDLGRVEHDEQRLRIDGRHVPCSLDARLCRPAATWSQATKCSLKNASDPRAARTAAIASSTGTPMKMRDRAATTPAAEG